MATDVKSIMKKSGKTDGKSNKLGGGGRFQQLKNKGLSSKLAAWIGDRKHSQSKMSSWAAAARRNHQDS